jgi:hypothetical protein
MLSSWVVFGKSSRCSGGLESARHDGRSDSLFGASRLLFTVSFFPGVLYPATSLLFALASNETNCCHSSQLIPTKSLLHFTIHKSRDVFVQDSMGKDASQTLYFPAFPHHLSTEPVLYPVLFRKGLYTRASSGARPILYARAPMP